MGICCLRQNSNVALYKNVTVAVLGLDDAGKTVTAKVLKGDRPDEVVPTIGFTNLKFTFKRFNVSMYDLGGGLRIRDIWKNYFAEVHGLIFVVDSSHRERIEECREVLSSVFEDLRVRGKPLLVLGNKQDVHGAMDSSEICSLLKLDAMANNYKSLCRIECCSALKQHKGKPDRAIVEGFQWLLDMIELNWPALKERVDRDFAEQKELEQRLRAEKAERVRILREEREKASAENNEMREADGNQMIIGDPFKALSDYRFSKKDEEVSNNNSMTKNESNVEADSKKQNQELEWKSPDHLDFDSNRDQSGTRTAYDSATSPAQTGSLGNGADRVALGGSSSESPDGLSVAKQHRPPRLPPTVLPPISMDVEQGEKKKQRRRRNKRSRVMPLPPSAEDSSEQSERCVDSRVEPMEGTHYADDHSTRNVQALCDSDLSSKTLPESCEEI